MFCDTQSHVMSCHVHFDNRSIYFQFDSKIFKISFDLSLNFLSLHCDNFLENFFHKNGLKNDIYQLLFDLVSSTLQSYLL